MRFLLLILIIGISIPAFAQDPYTMSLDDCRAYIKKNNLNWQAGITPYSYMPKELLQGMLPRFYVSVPVNVKQTKTLLPPNLKNPAALDWTNYNGTNWMTSVKNQGGCGSCWAFAVMGTLEAMININSNNPNLDYDLSEQILVSCNGQGWGCGGGPAGTAPANWVRQNGVSDEACFTYRASNSSCNLRCSDWASRLKYYKTVTSVCTSANTAQIKAALAEGPVGTAMQASVMQLRFYKGGNSGDWKSGDTNIEMPLNHAVVIVGYDDARNAWHWKNSWGTSWGEAGYGWCTYGAQQMGAYTWKGTAFAEGAAKSITVLYPNGGESFGPGEKLPVRWTSEGSISDVIIMLTTDSKSSWLILAAQTANDGQEDFQIPNNLNSDNCYVKVKDFADTEEDDSDNKFSIHSTGFKHSEYGYNKLPTTNSLNQNKPNPFRNSTSISFSIKENARVSLSVYDITGHLVRVIKANESMSAGNYNIRFSSDGLRAGVYTYCLTAGSFKSQKTMTLTK